MKIVMTEYFEIKVDKWMFRVPKDRFFNENDSWVKVDGDVATVGITDFLQNMIGDVIFVTPSKIGAEINQFEEVACFEGMKSVLDLISPVSGKVKEVNEELNDKPELVNQDPYEKGWFVKMQVKDFKTDREMLLNPEEYFKAMKRKIELERKKINKEN